VHLYGQPFDIDAVKAICDKHNLFLVEDAAQAQGARYKGKTVGGFGEMACFSFYPGKNLGACGEAGGITTNNEAYVKHIQSLRNHGMMCVIFMMKSDIITEWVAWKVLLSNVKLKYLESWNNRRRAIAKRYLSEIKNDKIKMQHTTRFCRFCFSFICGNNRK
jgi:dTDP-4-amino-4,6-dideoxygalactose transaminase